VVISRDVVFDETSMLRSFRDDRGGKTSGKQEQRIRVGD
jgi:ATP-dependent exoDNAse (exonuclease V) alpha subunit